jgi:molybdopterin-guanine dinucleotide biosynthesis protein A
VTAAGQPGLPVDGQAEILTDIYPDMGPLGGVYTGLCASRNTANITVACDMPFLNPGLLTWMAGLLDEHCAVVPRLDNGMIEPLHAVYSRKCVGTMEERLLKGQLGIYAFLKSVEVRYVEREESRKFDPEHLSFFNINYQSDLDRAIALTEEIER